MRGRKAWRYPGRDWNRRAFPYEPFHNRGSRYFHARPEEICSSDQGPSSALSRRPHFVTGNGGLIATHFNLQVSLPVYGLISCGLASSIYFFALRLAHDRVAGHVTSPRPIDALFDPS